MSEELIKLACSLKRDNPKESYLTLASKLKELTGKDIDPDDYKNIWLSYRRVKYLDKKEKKTINSTWKSIIAHQKAIKEIETQQESVTIRIDDDKPSAFAFLGDLHIGNVGTAYEQMLEDVNKIRATDGMYVFATGDEYDNYIASAPKGGNFEAIVSPNTQKKLAIDIMKRLQGKLLTTVLSCHTDWSRQHDDFDWAEYAAEQTGAANLGYGGEVILKLNNVDYRILVRHKMRGGSANPTKMHTNWMEGRGHADVVAVGHFHNPFVGEFDYQGKPVVTIRSGSYKVGDRYGQKIGDYKGVPGVPTIILNPNDKKIVPFRNLDDAIEYLKLIRKG